jgi:hypothetical protein
MLEMWRSRSWISLFGVGFLLATASLSSSLVSVLAELYWETPLRFIRFSGSFLYRKRRKAPPDGKEVAYNELLSNGKLFIGYGYAMSPFCFSLFF